MVFGKTERKVKLLTKLNNKRIAIKKNIKKINDIIKKRTDKNADVSDYNVMLKSAGDKLAEINAQIAKENYGEEKLNTKNIKNTFAVNKQKTEAKKFDKASIVSIKQAKKFKQFETYLYKTEGVNTLDEFRKIILDAVDTYNAGDRYVVLYHITDRNKASRITLKAGDFNTYDNLIDRLNEIKTKTGLNHYGSDVFFEGIDSLENAIDLTTFAIRLVEGEDVKGKNTRIMFKTEGIPDGFCGYDCLKKCGFEYSGDKTDLFNVQYMINVIKTNKLPIRMMANVFYLEKGSKIYENKLIGKIDYKIGKKMDRDSIYELKDENLHLIEIFRQCDDYKYTIIYDELASHFDIATNNEMKLLDNIYASFTGRIFKDKELIMTGKDMSVNNIVYQPKAEFKYVFFDYETVINFDRESCMQEYSISILVLSDSELKELTDADEQGNEETVKKIREKCCKTFIGYDCSTQFIDWILVNEKNTIFCFVGYNNCNFDNFILLDALLDYKKDELTISEIFYNGNQLLNFKLNGRHHTFDIHKHLMGSLRANCESFKIKCCKKLEFDHSKAQKLYFEDKLIDFITENNELKDYNEYDVLATAVLFEKYRRALETIPATKDYASKLSDVKTIGSLIYKVFDEHQKKKEIKLPSLSFKQYNDLQKYKIAGRVELFNGAQNVNERLVSTDVCSLYPFVMSVLNCYYPCGDSVKEVKKYQGDDVIGFYYCDIDQTNLKKANLPNIYAEKLPLENKWDSSNELKDYLISNVMIGLLKKYGCEVVIKNGFVFEDKMKSCDMFGFLLDFMQAKNNQDTLKKNKSNEYNSAMRETLKLLMNSLSGKVIEGLHTEKTEAVDTMAEYEKIKAKSTDINVINVIGDKVFITYEVDAEKICAKQQRPIYLGVLIYDYAKRYMYENSYSKVGLDKLLYTDTDASKFRYRHFIDWKKWVDDENIQVPHWEEVEKYDSRYKNHKIFVEGSKVFGSFEDELEDMIGDEYTFYCIEKKSWLYSYKLDGKWNSKFRFKGINGDARLLTLEEDFIEKKEIKHKAKGDKQAWNETVYMIEPFSEEKVYKYYNENEGKSIESGNEIKFFKQVYETGEGYVLCQSFRRIVKNSKRNVDIDDEDKFNDLTNSIQVNINIKHINIRKK